MTNKKAPAGAFFERGFDQLTFSNKRLYSVLATL
jgi:hypothetical protein